MSSLIDVQEQITRLETCISNAFSSIEAKHGTIPEIHSSDDLYDSIMSITGGDPWDGSWEYLTCRIHISADKGGSVSGGKSGIYNKGEVLTLIAAADSQFYEFNGWEVNGEIISTESTLIYTVSSEASIVARFTKLIPTFADATDAEFLQIAQALQSGEISVEQLAGWDVGATRNVSLSSFATYSSSTSRTKTQAAQTAQLVILHKKSNGVCAGKQFTDGSIPSFIIGFKDNVCKTYWNPSDNKYQNSLCWKVEDNIYNALPTEYKQAFGKQFKAITGIWASSTSSMSTTTYNRNMCSPAERELFGNTAGYDNDGYCIMKEYTALGSNAQFDYYKTTANRKHTNLSDYWWERSPDGNTDYSYGACRVDSDGTPSSGIVDYSVSGLAPFGCI